MIYLSILRHAKTNQVSPTGDDYDRRILPKGIAQSLDLKDYFIRHSFNVDQLLVSSAKRTMETFELIQSSFSMVSMKKMDELYHASLDELLQLLRKTATGQNILLIGHNFGISDLASYLTNTSITLGTAEFIKISLPIVSWDQLGKGMGECICRYRPQQ